MGCQIFQEDAVGDSVKGIAEVQIDNIHSLSCIHQVGDLVIEGDQVGQTGPTSPKPMLAVTDTLAILLTLALDAEQRLAQVEEFSSQTQINSGEVVPRLPVPEEQSPCGRSAQRAALPSRRRSPEQRRQRRVPFVRRGPGTERSQRPPRAPSTAWPGPARLSTAQHSSASGGSAGCAAGGRLPGPCPPPSPPLGRRFSAPSALSSRRRRRCLPRPRLLRLSAASPRSAPGAPAPRCPARHCCREPLGVPGQEICLDLETSAEGEDLLTSQTALTGAQKSYTKSPLEHYIPPFGVWTRVWHSAFTDRCRSLLERRGDGQTPTSFSEKKGASGAD
ncbi:uncharacterized protein LOC135442937 [Zonotrichia leucophrys gambelii]|uniref:uncharacterized protein LOC135442937 n=1 Tax=Zonotrichia leucophrys gambelii TaxID=257770 RepID=UPI003140B935